MIFAEISGIFIAGVLRRTEVIMSDIALTQNQLAKANDFYEKGHSLAAAVEQKIRQFSRDFSDIDPQLDDTAAWMLLSEEHEKNQILPPAQRKIAICDYYRDSETRCRIEAAFALSHGMTMPELFDETPAGRKKKRMMGDRFRAVFSPAVKEDAQQRRDREYDAGAELGNMYKFAARTFDPAKYGDLSDDSNFLKEEVLFDCVWHNPSSYLSAMDRQSESFRLGFAAAAEIPVYTDTEHSSIKSVGNNMNAYYTASGKRYQAYLNEHSAEDISAEKNINHLFEQNICKAVLNTFYKDAVQENGSQMPLTSQQAAEINGISGYGIYGSQEHPRQNSTPADQNRNTDLLADVLREGALFGSSASSLRLPSLKDIVSGQEKHDPLTYTFDPGVLLRYGAAGKADAENLAFWEQNHAAVYRGSDPQGNPVHPEEYRRAYEKGAFTHAQLEYTAGIYDKSIGLAFNPLQKQYLHDCGMNEFDCIFINGKSVRELYNKKRTDSKNTDAETAGIPDMKAMVVAAGMYGSSSITFTYPVNSRDGMIFAPPQYLNRQNDPADMLPDIKNSLWHRIRFGHETMQDKFDRASSGQEAAVYNAKAGIEKLKLRVLNHIRQNHSENAAAEAEKSRNSAEASLESCKVRAAEPMQETRLSFREINELEHSGKSVHHTEKSAAPPEKKADTLRK